MKTIDEIRLANLETLIKEAGDLSSLASKCNVNRQYLKQILDATETMSGTRRSIGDENARKLEAGMKKDRGWLDHDHEDDGDADYATIPQLNTELSMGRGRINDYVEVKGGLKFRRSFLRDEGIPEDSAEVVYAKRESMLPTIPDGSAVLINRADTAPRNGKVFALLDGEEGVRLKRLIRDGSNWIIRSDNSDKLEYPDEVFNSERHLILGRAVWFGSRL